MQMGIRNSRIGFRLKAPEASCGVRTSAMVELDFQGAELPVGVAQPYQGSEGTFFTSPTTRVRHLNVKVETPVVDVLAGQYWTLFGWGSTYQPNTVEIQGVPGEIYARTPQLRISKTIKANPMTVELALAATRPVQRDSATPDGQGGLRLSVDSWTGVQTTGSTGTMISPASVAVTGLVRHVAVDAFSAKPKTTNDLGMSAIAIDGYIPVVPGSKHHRDNALSVQGEFSTGYGYADACSRTSTPRHDHLRHAARRDGCGAVVRRGHRQRDRDLRRPRSPARHPVPERTSSGCAVLPARYRRKGMDLG